MYSQEIKDARNHRADMPLVAIAGQPPISVDTTFQMGAPLSPSGRRIAVDSRSLLLDGNPWLPVMGEFHYARYPRSEWRDELLKMKLGGLDIVASYVFWIHHEEIEGQFDWAGRRSLAEFVKLCADVGLYAIVRCGPWCHGECRNGGLPDWLLTKGVKVRSDDPGYLRYVRLLYAEIAAQLRGLLWKEGGPVIGVQVENEYGGPAEHLLTLKLLAQEAGLDVPLYTRTGWPKSSTRMPVGELLPLFGGYADGFWDRSIAQMPPAHQENFLFRTTRTEAATGSDQLGAREARDDDDTFCYPYLACEMGGGMMTSYHRRIRISPRDIESLALAKLGSGNNLLGYYMYHGGTNPDGITSMQESQATGYWNDLPVKTYDFQAPLGEFGQVRRHYHSLRRMHLFLRDFGATLAGMPARLPEKQPSTAADVSTLRWCIRTNGKSGFLFVNNYQRLQEMPRKEDAQFQLHLAKGDLRIPVEPTTAVPANTCFFWPFHFDMEGAHLVYATAQPICRLVDDRTTYYVFSEVEGVPAEFVFDRSSVTAVSSAGGVATTDVGVRITDVPAGTGSAIELRTEGGVRVAVILLSPKQSLACWKAEYLGRERLFLTEASLLVDGDSLRLRGESSQDLAVSILPAPALAGCSGERLAPEADGLFARFAECEGAQTFQKPVEFEQVRAPGYARPVRLGGERVAEAPTDVDFEHAGVWRIRLNRVLGPTCSARLRISYVGDVARVYLGGKLIGDNFYNGLPFEIGLARYAPATDTEELLLKVLPLRKDAPIYLPAEAWPVFCENGQKAALDRIDLIEDAEAVLTPAKEIPEPTPGPIGPPPPETGRVGVLASR